MHICENNTARARALSQSKAIRGSINGAKWKKKRRKAMCAAVCIWCPHTHWDEAKLHNTMMKWSPSASQFQRISHITWTKQSTCGQWTHTSVDRSQRSPPQLQSRIAITSFALYKNFTCDIQYADEITWSLKNGLFHILSTKCNML